LGGDHAGIQDVFAARECGGFGGWCGDWSGFRGGKLPDFLGLSFTVNGSKFLYGDFFNVLLAFVIAALSVYFLVVVPMNHLMAKVKKTPDPTTRACPECLSDIPREAKRCKFCTAVSA
jgi:large conductance mechanosensitive channel